MPKQILSKSKLDEHLVVHIMKKREVEKCKRLTGHRTQTLKKKAKKRKVDLKYKKPLVTAHFGVNQITAGKPENHTVLNN